MLAVYGWGMSWKELGSYLIVLLSLLAGLIVVAAIFAWLLGKIRQNRGNQSDISTRSDSAQESEDVIDDETK